MNHALIAPPPSPDVGVADAGVAGFVTCPAEIVRVALLLVTLPKALVTMTV